MIEQLKNKFGAIWKVEHRESTKLSKPGGYAATYSRYGEVLLDGRLSREEKQRGREYLREQLYETPVGETAYFNWEPSTSRPEKR